VRRIVILGRGGAGKSVLAQDLSRRIGVPAAELIVRTQAMVRRFLRNGRLTCRYR
jgi:adenylate kinase family enzyme